MHSWRARTFSRLVFMYCQLDHQLFLQIHPGLESLCVPRIQKLMYRLYTKLLLHGYHEARRLPSSLSPSCETRQIYRRLYEVTFFSETGGSLLPTQIFCTSILVPSTSIKRDVKMSLVLLLLLLLLLPLVVHSVPTIGARGVLGKDGNSIAYLADFRVNSTPIFDERPDVFFAMDTNAQHVRLSSNSCAAANTRITKLGLWSLQTAQDGQVASTSDSFLGNVDILCRKKGRNVAPLSSKNTSLPAQLSKVEKTPLRFAYVLWDQTFATLLFGKTLWIQYTGLGRTVPVVFVHIPLKLDATAASYMVKVTGIGFKEFLIRQKYYVEISVTQRFTTLPSKIYSFIVNQFQQEASEKKIKRVSASAYNGKLSLCYQMRSSDVRGFRNVTMVFSSKFRWSVPADKYLVPKPGTSNVFCLAYLQAPGNGSHGVIGTLQQERRAMDFNLETKSLGVSFPLIGPLTTP
ncbi:uncharacterized protein LOC9646050 isoform X2 [Selaginella moellendorffii]|uniref:uncharacterized protein LOC9646050 isoform X2 n=1 Tax=Selaginella moellendorffii TaxID=88036 RepID=UPI000D1C7F67|nr:uncharacterized protein LOC9646050 isoform X2 [Selaginella moellendorffii]|eukprot:XP_024530479.1 uncharacterized protein LOC9646050 isoform X2 [Selaginella moellendorffii]